MRASQLSFAEPSADSSSARAIREAVTPRDIALARSLFVEYAQWLNVDLCFQGFDAELATLPGAYARPLGRLLIVGPPEGAFGCIALRPFGGRCGCATSRDVVTEAVVAEVKRLYVQPANRGERWGRRLASTIISEARSIGYRELKLDTLGWMAAARALYSDLGFRECAPYYDNPLTDVVYMSLDLSRRDGASSAR